MGEIRIKRDNSDWDNRPAHRYTNGQWVDIPTHHFINNRWQGELTSQSPLKFRADGEMLDWRVEGKTSGNLYPILIGEDTWGNLNDATHSNNNGELVVVMGTADNNSGVYSPSDSTIRTVHKVLSTYSWSVEIKADSPMKLLIGFETDGVKYINITNEYQKFTFSNQSFTSDRAFVIYNRSGVVHTVYLRNFMLNEGSTALPYEPYGGVGDWDETEQKYRIPVTVEGENLWDGTFINTSSWGISFSLDDDGYMVGSSNNDPREWKYSASQIKMTLGAGTYALVLQGIPPTQSWSGAMIYTSGGSELANNQNLVNKPLIIMPFTLAKETSIGIMVKVVNGKYRVQLLEGSYTSDTLPPYEVNLYTDHQLMDGDSIDFSTDQTAIPLATGNNTLTVDTAVQPKSVFIKFEG